MIQGHATLELTEVVPDYGCGNKPSAPTVMNDVVIASGTHDVTYKSITFQGYTMNGSTGAVVNFAAGSMDTYNITFDHCVFKTPGLTASDLVKVSFGSGSGVNFHDITFSYCWFEPCHLHSIDLAMILQAHGYNLTIDHCTFEQCDATANGTGGPISLSCSGVATRDEEQRLWENVNITSNLFYGSRGAMIEWRGIAPRTGYEETTRSTFSDNKLGFAAATQFSFPSAGWWIDETYPAQGTESPHTGCRGAHFEDNVIDETWNPGEFTRVDAYKGLWYTGVQSSGGVDGPRGEMNECTWSGNTFDLYGNASQVAIVRDSIAARSPKGGDNVFTGNTWTSTSTALTSIGGNLVASEDATFTNEYFDLPGFITFGDDAVGTGCTFTSRCPHMGGTFDTDVSQTLQDTYNLKTFVSKTLRDTYDVEVESEGYGCEKPTTTSTLTNHKIYGGTHDVTYSYVRFEGDAAVSGHETVCMWLGRSGTPDADLYNITFDHCVFATSSYATTGLANAFHMWNTSATGKVIYNITFDHCWFEPQTRMGVELNGRGGWWHDVTIDHCTFEGSCSEQFSCDMSPVNGDPVFPYGVTVGGVVRGVEGLSITNCLFEGTGATVAGKTPSSWKMGLEFGCVYPYASNNMVGRSEFTGNKVGRCASSWINWSYSTKGTHYMTLSDNVFDFAYNDHSCPAHNDSPFSSAANLNNMTFDGNSWTLGTENNQPYYFVAGGSHATGSNNTFIDETWTKPSGSIGSWCEMPFTNSTYTNCDFYLPKILTLGSGSTYDPDCYFQNGQTGGSSTTFLDVTASPYNIDNTGTTSVTSALGGASGVLATIRNAGKVAYFPAGTYLLSTPLTVPDGCGLAGPLGTGPTYCTAWLQGKVIFGSDSSFADLKTGPASAGVAGLRNSDGADSTSITRCHFRGGGDGSTAERCPVTVGYSADASNITFTDCEVERSLGTARNTVSVYASGNTLDTITFDGCHFGVTNGSTPGAGRWMVECWTADGEANKWENLTFTDCTFEPSDWGQLDFACYGPNYTGHTSSGRGENVLVSGCLFKGAGVGGTGSYRYAICNESALNIEITGNTFYRCSSWGIHAVNAGWPADNNMTVTDNVFDYDTDYISVAAGQAFLRILVDNGTFTGNTFTTSAELLGDFDALVDINGATQYEVAGGTGNVVTGNTFNHNASQPYHIREVNGATGNTITPNTMVHL